MKINKAYKIELNPNKTTLTLLNKAAGTARFAYNWALGQRIKLYETEKKSTTAFTQHKELCAVKKETYPWMYEVSKCVPQFAIHDVDTAFKNFFRGLKRKQNVGFPKFKKKGQKESFKLEQNISVLEDKIKLPRLGTIKLKETRNIQGRILFATVSKDVDRWFVSVTTEQEIPEVKIQNGQVVGIDLGLTTYATLSDGSKIENPKILKKYLNKINILQRRLSKKQKGSANRKKAQVKLAKTYRKVRNTRNDFLHKVTTVLAKTKQEIVVETLKVKNMVRNRKLAFGIQDVAWAEFVRQLEYKCKWYGSQLTKVDTFFPSSKTCSVCGYKLDKLPLQVREWVCPDCNTKHDRDINAAKNLVACSKSVPSDRREVKPVENPLSRGLFLTPRYDSMKQEVNDNKLQCLLSF